MTESLRFGIVSPWTLGGLMIAECRVQLVKTGIGGKLPGEQAGELGEEVAGEIEEEIAGKLAGELAGKLAGE
jgi:hypothetical protein